MSKLSTKQRFLIAFIIGAVVIGGFTLLSGPGQDNQPEIQPNETTEVGPTEPIPITATPEATPTPEPARATVTFNENRDTNTVEVTLVSVQDADFIEVRAGSSFSTWQTEQIDVGGRIGNNVTDIEAIGSSARFTYQGNGTATAIAYKNGTPTVLQQYEYGP